MEKTIFFIYYIEGKCTGGSSHGKWSPPMNMSNSREVTDVLCCCLRWWFGVRGRGGDCYRLLTYQRNLARWYFTLVFIIITLCTYRCANWSQVFFTARSCVSSSVILHFVANTSIYCSSKSNKQSMYDFSYEVILVYDWIVLYWKVNIIGTIIIGTILYNRIFLKQTVNDIYVL